jgi:hypothetical protein
MPGSEGLARVLAEWAGQAQQRLTRRVRRELLARENETSPARLEAREALETLRGLPADERLVWLDTRSWQEDGVVLGCLLLEEAETLPPEDRLEWPRLAARVSALSDIATLPALAPVLDDTLGRAGLMEVRALRRRGQLAEARAMFGELEASFELEDSPRAQLLSLCSDRALSAGLLALDEYRTVAADRHFRRCARCLRVAGNEEDDAELLFGQARLDLVRGRPTEAVERLLRAAPFESSRLRLASAELVTRAALRTGKPVLARPPLGVLTCEVNYSAGDVEKDVVVVLEASARWLEARFAEALELLAGPARRFRAEGRLLPSLQAAIVATRAELALGRPQLARKALAAGVSTRFRDVPETPAITETLAEIAEAAATGIFDRRLLDRVDLWLILVAESPGVGLMPQA